jgi:2-polyprenyl-3-methyl-5-hydroxy-6-metoxy-1,4-benzoquinol methylase
MAQKFEVSFPYFLEYPVRVVIKKIGILGFLGWFLQKYGKRMIKRENLSISERIIEIPSVFMLLSSACRPGANILEIGHVNSSLALELSSLGYKVTAIDLRDYPFSHPNLKSIKADFFDFNFDSKFDCIIAISTIEHFGQNKRYGGQNDNTNNLDRKALEKIDSLLKESGKFIVSTPFASSEKDFWYKVYTKDLLRDLIYEFFKIESAKFYIRKNNIWSESANESPDSPEDGVAIFLLSKRA